MDPRLAHVDDWIFDLDNMLYPRRRHLRQPQCRFRLRDGNSFKRVILPDAGDHGNQMLQGVSSCRFSC